MLENTAKAVAEHGEKSSMLRMLGLLPQRITYNT